MSRRNSRVILPQVGSCSVGSSVRISQSAFTANSAGKGGAIQALNCKASSSAIPVDVAVAGEDLRNGDLEYLCSTRAGQSIEMENVKFVDNAAKFAGGAVVIEEYCLGRI